MIVCPYDWGMYWSNIKNVYLYVFHIGTWSWHAKDDQNIYLLLGILLDTVDTASLTDLAIPDPNVESPIELMQWSRLQKQFQMVVWPYRQIYQIR